MPTEKELLDWKNRVDETLKDLTRRVKELEKQGASTAKNKAQ